MVPVLKMFANALMVGQDQNAMRKNVKKIACKEDYVLKENAFVLVDLKENFVK
jgi:hypothetical protein